MKNAVFTLILAAGVAACATPPAPDGAPPPVSIETVNSCENPVRLTALTTAAGAEEQDRWLDENYPAAIPITRSAVQCGEVPVERVVLDDAGTRRTVLFDVSSFYGKVGEEDLDDLLEG